MYDAVASYCRMRIGRGRIPALLVRTCDGDDRDQSASLRDDHLSGGTGLTCRPTTDGKAGHSRVGRTRAAPSDHRDTSKILDLEHSTEETWMGISDLRAAYELDLEDMGIFGGRGRFPDKN